MSNTEWVNPCQGCNARQEHIRKLEAQLAALRASAVAEPVAIVHQINGPFASPVAHPAPAAPVPASDRSAFEKIVRSVCALDAPPNDGDEYEKGIHNAGLDILAALASLPEPVVSVREADQKVLADLDALIRSEQTGSRSTMQIAMAAEREIRRLASLPAPEAAPTQEEIAKKLMEFDNLQTWELTDRERATYLRHAAALLALKAAPAK